MTGSRSTRRRRSEFRRLRRNELVLLLVPVLLGIAPVVLWRIEPALGIAVIVLGFGLGLGSVWLPAVPRQVALWVIGLGGALAWGVLDAPLALSWLVLFPCGVAVGGHLRSFRTVSEPSPPATDANRMEHDRGGETIVTTSPSAEAARTAIERLDGEHRTMISLFRGQARLDVGGDAAGVIMVYHSDDPAAARPEWSHLITPGAPDTEVEVRLADDLGHFRTWQTTTLEPARAAVAEFLRTGRRADGLDWRTDREVADLRPPGLQEDGGDP